MQNGEAGKLCPPIKYLKIDIHFVRELPTNRANQHLVKAIVGLAMDFDYETMAEGVELNAN